MEPIVREARLSDAAAIAEIHVATWRHAYRGIVPRTVLASLSVEQRTKDWQTRLQPSARMNFVIEMEGVILGWASIGPARDDDHKEKAAELYGIYMGPAHIGRALGRILYEGCEKAIGPEGYPFILLWVLEANHRARRFYERAGFRPDGVTKVIALGGAELPELRYRKELAGS